MYKNIFKITIDDLYSVLSKVKKIRDTGFIVADGVNLNFPDEFKNHIYKYVAVPEGKTEEELYDLSKILCFNIVSKITDATIYEEKYAEDDIRFCYVRDINKKTYCIYTYKAVTDMSSLTTPENFNMHYKYIKTTYVINNKDNAMQMISSYPTHFKILCKAFEEAGFDIPNIFTLVEKNFDSDTGKSDDKVICSIYLNK